MKTKALKYFKSVLLVLAMVSMAACEVAIDGFYDDDNIGGGYYNKSRELCTAVRRSIFIWTGLGSIIFACNIPMAEYLRMNTVSDGIGKTRRNPLFA